jgi:hypothetical protein
MEGRRDEREAWGSGDDGDGDGDDGDVVDWTGVLYGDAGDPRRPRRRARPQTAWRGSNADDDKNVATAVAAAAWRQWRRKRSGGGGGGHRRQRR